MWRHKTLNAGVVVLRVRGVRRGADAARYVIHVSGRLKSGGSPVNAAADFQFTLYDAATGGGLVAGPLTVLGVSVADGLFTAQVDFGVSAFNGSARWIEIAVRAPAGSGHSRR